MGLLFHSFIHACVGGVACDLAVTWQHLCSIMGCVTWVQGSRFHQVIAIWCVDPVVY